jgi:hypothetical protein
MFFACLMDVTVEYLSQQWCRRFGTPNIQLQFSMWHTTGKEMLIHYNKIDVHVTVHRDKFLIINQLDAPISQIYFGMKLYMLQTVPLSIIRSFSLYTQQWYMSYRFADSLQTCMTYTIAVCTLKNSWWWTEELSEICRVSFQNKFEKLVHLVGLL